MSDGEGEEVGGCEPSTDSGGTRTLSYDAVCAVLEPFTVLFHLNLILSVPVETLAWRPTGGTS